MCGVFGIRAPDRDVARVTYFGLSYRSMCVAPSTMKSSFGCRAFSMTSLLQKSVSAFEPAMSEAEREARYGGWRDALAKVKSRL